MSGEAAPGAGTREERYRLAAMAAGVPIVLLDAPLVLSIDGGRSLLSDALREPTAIAGVGCVLAWPLLVGGVSLAYGLRRKVPGLGLFAVPATFYILAAAGTAFLFSAAPFLERRARQEPSVFVAAIAGWMALYLLLRGFRRAGWERWAQLLAGMWLGHGTVAAAALFADASPSAVQPAGAWIFLFAMALLLPLVGWALWPRRGEVSLRR